jgi:hypothetical protein
VEAANGKRGLIVRLEFPTLSNGVDTERPQDFRDRMIP